MKLSTTVQFSSPYSYTRPFSNMRTRQSFTMTITIYNNEDSNDVSIRRRVLSNAEHSFQHGHSIDSTTDRALI